MHCLDSEELQFAPFEFEACYLGFVVISEIEAVGQKPSPLTTKTIRSLPTKDRQSLASKKANTNRTGTVSAYQNQIHLFLGNKGLIVIIPLKENILGLHRLE